MTDLNITNKARGEFKLLITRANGKVEDVTFPNMLLNNAFAASTLYLTYCTVGSGTTPPVGSDTQLESRLGSNLSAVATTAELSPVFNGSTATVARKTTMTFSAGSIVGNVSELAIYHSASIISSNIVVRALVTDVNGDPTTITLGSGDQLTVEHTLYVDIETRPTPQVMNINGADYTVSVVVGYPEYNALNGVTQFAAYAMPYISSASNSARIAETVNVGSVGSQAYLSTSGAYYATYNALTHDVSTPSLGKKSSTFTISIPTSTQLTGEVPIGGIVMSQGTSSFRLGVLFDPPLPKNNTVGYTFAVTATLERV